MNNGSPLFTCYVNIGGWWRDEAGEDKEGAKQRRERKNRKKKKRKNRKKKNRGGLQTKKKIEGELFLRIEGHNQNRRADDIKRKKGRRRKGKHREKKTETKREKNHREPPAPLPIASSSFANDNSHRRSALLPFFFFSCFVSPP